VPGGSSLNPALEAYTEKSAPSTILLQNAEQKENGGVMRNVKMR